MHCSFFEHAQKITEDPKSQLKCSQDTSSGRGPCLKKSPVPRKPSQTVPNWSPWIHQGLKIPFKMLQGHFFRQKPSPEEVPGRPKDHPRGVKSAAFGGPPAQRRQANHPRGGSTWKLCCILPPLFWILWGECAEQVYIKWHSPKIWYHVQFWYLCFNQNAVLSCLRGFIC